VAASAAGPVLGGGGRGGAGRAGAHGGCDLWASRLGGRRCVGVVRVMTWGGYRNRSVPLVSAVSVESRRLSDGPKITFDHAPPHKSYVTYSKDQGPEAELARGRPVARGPIFHPWVAVESKT